MEPELLHYEKIVEDALRSVVRTSLEQVSTFGLPDGHSLYITFMTHAVGVDIPQRLVETYPEEMTIVLEHQFWNLTIDEDWFSVELSFNRRQERLEVPFAAVTSFADPSVPFGLKFELTGAAGTDDADGRDATGTTLSESVLDTSETAPAANTDSDGGEAGDPADSQSDDGDGKRDGEGDDPPMGEVVNLDSFRKNR